MYKVLEANFIICQNVAFAVSALFCGQDRAMGKVPYIAKVEGTIDACGHLSLNDLDQCPRRFTDGIVFRSKNTAGMNDACVQSTVFDSVKYGLGCQGLGLAVAAKYFIGIKAADFLDSLSLG